jgi:transketolase
MRWQFQLALHDLAMRDESIVLVWCDVGGGLFKKFAADMPDRCVNVGICEQSAVSAAAGMAMAGLRPVVYSIAPFLLERAYEQIKLDVVQQNLGVLLVGHNSELQQGPTHRTDDPEALCSALKLRCYKPCDKSKVAAHLACAIAQRDPAFLLLE